ncbi:ATP-binding protein [Spiroplasma melliferum]|uniref:ATP-binding protein n=1 Tax=Spiroplasma melliferum TaxID=2134 RepID=UPI000C77546B|nr:ATP-binding protein [Spiroplasma melliferum]
MKTYTFDYVDNKIVQEFGKNLYKNTYSMLTELVANAYDADAKNVLIWFRTDNSNKICELNIFDDGHGMDQNDIQNKFLQIGYSKRTQCNKSLKYNRLPMGRKGFGKLAVFGIGNNIELYSKKDTECSFLETLLLSKDDIDNKINPHEIEKVCKTKIENFNLFQNKFNTGHGTMISISDFNKINAINDVKNKIDYRLYKAFKPLYAKNIEEKFKMNIYILKNDYLDFNKIEIVDSVNFIQYSFLKVYNLDYFSKTEISNINKNSLSNKNSDIAKRINNEEYSKNRIISVIESDNDAKELKKWLSKELKKHYSDNQYEIKSNIFKELVSLKGYIGILDEIDQKNKIGGIVSVYARNRVMISNIFDFLENTQVGSNYIIGDIFADYLDTDDENDIATPGRDAVDENDERYICLRLFIKFLVNKLISFRNKILEKIENKNIDENKEKYNNFVKEYSVFEQNILIKNPSLKEKFNVFAKYIADLANEKLPQKIDTIFISFKNYTLENKLNLKNLINTKQATSFTSYFISEVLKEILGFIEKFNSRINIIYTEVNADINAGTDITRFIKENALSRKIENCCYFICASINYVDNWFTDIEYGGIYALNDEMKNSEFVIFDCENSKHALSKSVYNVSPLASKSNYFNFSSLFIKKEYKDKIVIDDNKLKQFVDNILSILKTNICIEINDIQKEEIKNYVKTFLTNNVNKINLFLEAIKLIDIDKYEKYTKI